MQIAVGVLVPAIEIVALRARFAFIARAGAAAPNKIVRRRAIGF